MTSLDWDLLAVGSAAGLGIGLLVVRAFGRRKTKRRAHRAQVADATSPRTRIDVVAIDAVSLAAQYDANGVLTLGSLRATETGERIDVERIADQP